MRTAMLLGAGFSKWAADVPVASELFDFAIVVSTRDERKLGIVKSAKTGWDYRHPGTHSEKFISHVLQNRGELQRSALLWYVTRRLSEPFMWYASYGGARRRRTLGIDEPYKRHLPGIERARQFIGRQMDSPLVGIITTNYDLLVEYALGSRGFRYERVNEVLHGAGAHPRRRSPIVLSGSLPYAKLHGSISWDGNRRYADGRRAITGNALIVAPTPEKEPHPALAAVWQLSASILQSAERIIVFGFAFNPYDTAVLSHLSGEARDVRLVEIVDPMPQTARAQRVWPSAEIVSWEPP